MKELKDLIKEVELEEGEILVMIKVKGTEVPMRRITTAIEDGFSAGGDSDEAGNYYEFEVRS